MALRSWRFVPGVWLLVACGSGASTPTVHDAGTDLGTTDVTQEFPPDTGIDAAIDAVVDVPRDVCPDALADGNCLLCTAAQRVCNGACVNPDDPTVGCADPSCTPCAFANATAVCGDAGRCAMGACNSGYTDCNHDPSDGCEVATGTDPANCGGCGTVCSVPNATAGCAMGQCTVGTCAAGFGDCDMAVTNGCETPTTADVNNCGGCGTHCDLSEATSSCAGGLCTVVTCATGFANCDGMAANGCEANLQTDASNCAMCGNACTTANGTPACSAGACAVGHCTTGFGDCDGSPSNGCETDLTTSAAHCGACGTPCTYANAQGVCAASVCSMGACNAGYTDCDMSATNGCEVRTSADVNNCGTCGLVCGLNNAIAGCAGGACAVVTCNAGTADCDHVADDGCEVDTNDLTNNCGACGHVCSLSQAEAECDTGICRIAACNPGYADCNMAPADGCEVNINTTVSHCGDCGMPCNFAHAAAGCVDGSCTLGACATGYADCDGDFGNGCESLLATDANNCGSCGHPCADGQTCSASACH